MGIIEKARRFLDGRAKSGAVAACALAALVLAVGGIVAYRAAVGPAADEPVRISERDRRADAGKQVGENEINVSYTSSARFGTDGRSVKFNVRNIEGNNGPIRFGIFDEDGEAVYESAAIEPGYEMPAISLGKPLAAGTYYYTIRVGYVDGGNVQSVFPLRLTVA